MKKRLLAVLLCLLLVFAAFPASSFAHTNDFALEESLANDLKALGLFQGVSDTNFALQRAPTRTEALVMLIRVLGCEKEALKGGNAHPFTDVAEWADPYVGYAYQNKLTDGVSADKFGSSNASAAMYLTFVLRALGYSDQNNEDFTWSDPYSLAKSVGIMPEGVDTANFLRGDVVLVSYAALGAAMKDGSSTLAEKLVKSGAFTAEDYNANIDLSKIGMTPAPVQPQTAASAPETELKVLTAKQIYEKCSDAVFYIELYDSYGYMISSGSGFFLGTNGMAVTNYHVIDGAASASVMLSDGTVCNVEGLYDSDPDLDLALIKVEGSGFSTLEQGDPSAISAGEDIYAIGSPLGYDNTISNGIISNVKRTMGEVDYIQFTAAISSGSSGGALINEYGQVIGITSASSIFGEVSQNVNFAVPISMVSRLSTSELKDFSSQAVIPEASLECSESKIRLYVGDTYSLDIYQSYDLDATITYYDLSDDIDDIIVEKTWGSWKDHYNVSLQLTGVAPGSTTIELVLTDGNDIELAYTDIEVEVVEKAPKASLSFSSASPSVKVGATVQVKVTHNQEGVVTVKYNLPGDPCVSCSWGEFEDNYTCPLYITGVKTGRSWVQVLLCDEAGNVLCTKNMYVTVQ